MSAFTYEGQLILNVEITGRKKMDQCRIYVEITGNFHMISASGPLFEELKKTFSPYVLLREHIKKVILIN